MPVADIVQTEASPRVVTARRGKPRVWTSAQWLDYYRRNAEHRRPIPWEQGAAGAPELALLGSSIQGWQRGETSDGSHLRAAAGRYAEQTSDALLPEVTEFFIREEQCHSALMGRYLDLAGLGRVEADWGDRIFRALRYRRCDLESWMTPVIVVEVLALVYFDAIRRATGSPTLRAVCEQILSDEVAHVRFQSERFAQMFRGRSPLRRRLALARQRALFFAGVVAVWVGHGRVLRAGGYGWRHYWRSAWGHMRHAWARMDPERYEW